MDATLTKDDIQKIKEKKYPGFTGVLFFVIVIVVISMGLMFIKMLNESEILLFSRYKLHLLFPVGSTFLFLIVIHVLNHKYTTDIKRRKKVIKEYKVIRKYQTKRNSWGSPVVSVSTMLYYLVFDKYTFEVRKEIYDKIEEGDDVKAEIAPKSDVVLSVNV